MITANEILDEISRMLKEAFSECRAVYMGRCPKELDRPSFSLEMTAKKEEQAGVSLLQTSRTIRICCFAAPDESGVPREAELPGMQEKVTGLFRRGYIRVGSRAPKVTASTGEITAERAPVELKMDYFEKKEEEKDTLPLMGEITATVTGKG